MYKLDKIKDQRPLVENIRKAANLEQYVNLVKIKDKVQKNLAMRTLAVCAMEKIAFNAIGMIAFNLKNLECLIDNATNGLWVKPPEDDKVKNLSQIWAPAEWF